jgi:hypothetical protein
MTRYTIKDAAGVIHEFKTLKAARASTVGFTNGMRIIAQINKPAAKRAQAAAQQSAAA